MFTSEIRHSKLRRTDKYHDQITLFDQLIFRIALFENRMSKSAYLAGIGSQLAVSRSRNQAQALRVPTLQSQQPIGKRQKSGHGLTVQRYLAARYQLRRTVE